MSILFSTVVVQNYIPTNRIVEFPFLHTISSICSCGDFNVKHSAQCEVLPYCRLNLYFSNNWQCWTSFHVPFGHFKSLKKSLFRYFAHFPIRFFGFVVVVVFYELVFIFEKLSPCQLLHYQIFLSTMSFCSVEGFLLGKCL